MEATLMRGVVEGELALMLTLINVILILYIIAVFENGRMW